MLMQYQLILITLSILPYTVSVATSALTNDDSNGPMLMQYQLILISLSILLYIVSVATSALTNRWQQRTNVNAISINFNLNFYPPVHRQRSDVSINEPVAATDQC